jgi:RNA polymerase I specific transcription initiation factor RRN3
MHLVPQAKRDIFSIISNFCPYWTRPVEQLNFFYEQCFTVLEYHPAIRSQVLEFVIEKSLEIDVHIKIQEGGNVMIDGDEDDEGDNDANDGVFDMDGVVEKPAADATTPNKNPDFRTNHVDVNELSDKVRDEKK